MPLIIITDETNSITYKCRLNDDAPIYFNITEPKPISWNTYVNSSEYYTHYRYPLYFRFFNLIFFFFHPTMFFFVLYFSNTKILCITIQLCFVGSRWQPKVQLLLQFPMRGGISNFPSDCH